MPSNHTENYQLSQWERSDKVLMEDFNADNEKIDAALAEHAVALTVLDKLGNCAIEHFTYVGTGTYGPKNPTVLNFTRQPLFVMVFGNNECALDSPLFKHFVCLANTYRQDAGTHYSTWSNNQLSFYSNTVSTATEGYDNPRAQMNTKNAVYLAVAFFAEDDT